MSLVVSELLLIIIVPQFARLIALKQSALYLWHLRVALANTNHDSDPSKPLEQWIALTLFVMLNACRSVLRDATCEEARLSLRSQLTKCLRKDTEQW